MKKEKSSIKGDKRKEVKLKNGHKLVFIPLTDLGIRKRISGSELYERISPEMKKANLKFLSRDLLKDLYSDYKERKKSLIVPVNGDGTILSFYVIDFTNPERPVPGLHLKPECEILLQKVSR